MVTTTEPTLRTLGYVILFVKDMNRTLAFYRDTLKMTVRNSSPDWSELATEGTTLAFHQLEEGAPAIEHRGLPEIVFAQQDVLGTREALVKRGVKIAEPKIVFEMGDQAGVSCHFRDPDGNRLSVFGIVPKNKIKA